MDSGACQLTSLSSHLIQILARNDEKDRRKAGDVKVLRQTAVGSAVDGANVHRRPLELLRKLHVVRHERLAVFAPRCEEANDPGRAVLRLVKVVNSEVDDVRSGQWCSAAES